MKCGEQQGGTGLRPAVQKILLTPMHRLQSFFDVISFSRIVLTPLKI